MALAKNSMEGKAEEYLKRIENRLADINSDRDLCKERCGELRQDIKEIYIEAKDQGVLVKALKGLVKHRQLERKQQEIGRKLDIDEAAAYQSLVDTLGELGMAAAKNYVQIKNPDAPDGHPGVPIDDDRRDFRPPHLRNTNPDDLEKLGRGLAGV